jgi:SAM-dependent methyltransferase
MHDTSMMEMQKFVLTLPKAPLRIADIGSCDICGTYKPLFTHPEWEYVGHDLKEGRNVDVVLGGEDHWSNVPSSAYDVVISGQALEHCLHPWTFISEVARILKPGGRTCIIAPHTWVFHNYPQDCWRILPTGMKAILTWFGLEVEQAYHNMHPNGQGDTVGIATKPGKI